MGPPNPGAVTNAAARFFVSTTSFGETLTGNKFSNSGTGTGERYSDDELRPRKKDLNSPHGLLLRSRLRPKLSPIQRSTPPVRRPEGQGHRVRLRREDRSAVPGHFSSLPLPIVIATIGTFPVR